MNALNAHAQTSFTQTNLASSLQKLSSGLRINSAKDDASGLAIANTLKSQANTLGQAIRNANDGMGIIQIADKAMDEQIKILDTIKTKATQAAQDGQTTQTRKAIQSDINRLIESLDNIANTTSYNGLALLSGSFTKKEFQIGAYSNQSIKASIGATSSDKIGHVRSEAYRFSGAGFDVVGNLNANQYYHEPKSPYQDITLTFKGANNQDITLESVKLSHSVGTGLGALADVINKNSDLLGGIKAKAVVQKKSSIPINNTRFTLYHIDDFTINGVNIGKISNIKQNDSDGRLVQAINAKKNETGVEASVDEGGYLVLTSRDGRAIETKGKTTADNTNQYNPLGFLLGNTFDEITVGTLVLTKHNASDIQVKGGAQNTAFNGGSMVSEAVVNLRNTKGIFDKDIRSAVGANALTWTADTNAFNRDLGGGVTTLQGAMLVMDIAQSAMKQLDSIRADLGSVQQQMQSTINNITITQVNVKSAESGIREVDFASESANYSNLNILAQAGSYALSQSNATQQSILRLLQ